MLAKSGRTKMENTQMGDEIAVSHAVTFLLVEDDEIDIMAIRRAFRQLKIVNVHRAYNLLKDGIIQTHTNQFSKMADRFAVFPLLTSMLIVYKTSKFP
jgi:hypothetical protein